MADGNDCMKQAIQDNYNRIKEDVKLIVKDELDALVPVGGSQYDGVLGQFRMLLQQGQALGKNILFDELTLPVQIAEGLGCLLYTSWMWLPPCLPPR